MLAAGAHAMAGDGKPEKPEGKPAASPPPLPPIAGKARDLEALRNAVVDAANVGAGLWFSYLFGLLYFVIAVGSVTHRNLLFENPIKLPFLNVDLPLIGFFVLGPAVFLIVHAYVLLHFAMLADKVGVFHAELQAQISDDAIRASLRRQLPSNIFVQFLAGPREVREGLMGMMLRLISQISLVIGPLALLVFFQLQFLPYHDEAICWWQRIAVVADLALLWALWPSVARGETASIGWLDFRKPGVIGAAAASLVPIVMVFAIATFPGEWLHKNPLSIPFVPEMKDGALHLATPHEALVAGDIDFVARKPTSLWSNRLVLPNLEQPAATFSARGRQLEGAVLLSASLRGIDFTAARLAGAVLNDADLREAKFTCAETQAKVGLDAEAPKPDGQKAEKPEQHCAQLQHASLQNAQLERAKFDGASMRGISFRNATLQNASFIGATLPEARLDGTQLRGAVFDGADLAGANFERAQLQGASFTRATLSGGYFRYAQLQGAVMDRTRLQGADFRQAQLQGAWSYYADFTAASFEETQAQGASFEKARFDAALFVNAQFQGANFFDASLKGARFGREVGLQAPQLQGASFNSANLDAAFFNAPPVWRSDARELRPYKSVFVDQPMPGPEAYGRAMCGRDGRCAWSADSFVAVRQAVESRVPTGKYRDEALERIAMLDPAKPADDEEKMTASWNELAARPKPPAGDSDRVLAALYREIGCNKDNSVYALRRIISNVLGIFDGSNEALMQMLETFDRDPKCENARAMTERDRSVLATMVDAAKKLRNPTAPPPQKQ
jgi:uncharacterized protein YjbI with pentapeptide repeats